MTGQCDHIVGLFRSPYTQHGDCDHLARASEGLEEVDEPFTYCPSCGLNMETNGVVIRENITECAFMMNGENDASS